MVNFIVKLFLLTVVMLAIITLIFFILNWIKKPVENFIEKHNSLAWTYYLKLITIFIGVVLALLVNKIMEK